MTPGGRKGPRRTYQVGQKFGQWTLVERLGYRGGEHSRWRVRCDCGATHVVVASNVTSGKSTRCAACAARARERGEGGKWT